MKHLNYLPILGIIISLTSCSEEGTPLPAEESTESPIEVSATATAFTRTEGFDMLSDYGLSLFALRHTGTSTELYFSDDYDYDPLGGGCNSRYGYTHNWVDKTSPLDFYAVSPTISDDQLNIVEVDSIVFDFRSEQLEYNNDLMLATHEGISRQTYSGSLPLVFKHILTKLTFEYAFRETLENPFQCYYLSLEIFGPKCNKYNATGGYWVVSDKLPADFDITTPEVDPIRYVSDPSHNLEATPEGTDLQYYTAAETFMIPQNYQVRCSLNGYTGDYTSSSIAYGHFDLDLTGKKGYHYIVKLSTTVDGEGLPILNIQTTDEPIDIVD